MWLRIDWRGRGPDECWPWTGTCTSSGYGSLTVGSRTDGTRRTVSAHVAALIASGVKVEVGQRVRHTCDNPPCCNPAHLRNGTQADNLADMRAKGRSARGTRNRSAKLTEDAVRAMRCRAATGESLTALAAEYSVAWPTVQDAVLGRTWAHVGC